MTDTGGTPGANRNAANEGLFDTINQPYGATPIEEDAREALQKKHQGIRTMAQLNALEAENITRGLIWVRGEGFDTAELLNQNVLRDVHNRMFAEVWQWAGQLRRRELTIGIDPVRISEEWKIALDDAAYWFEHQTFAPIEVVLRLHHRTVQIHPFVNGNGRHARLMSEELALSVGLSDTLTWGGHLGLPSNELRSKYLSALRALDMSRNEIGPLMEFAVDPDVPFE